MTKQQISLIGAGTVAAIILIIALAFGGINPVANANMEGDNIFSSVVSSFGEGEDDEDEMEEGEMDDEDEMEEGEDDEDEMEENEMDEEEDGDD